MTHEINTADLRHVYIFWNNFLGWVLGGGCVIVTSQNFLIIGLLDLFNVVATFPYT